MNTQSRIKKKNHFLTSILLGCVLAFTVYFVAVPVVYAQEATSILPNQDVEPPLTCLELREKLKTDPLAGKYLAKKITCGRMTLADIPYYVKHALDFLFGIIGTLAVIAIMRAGLLYMLTKSDSGKGKKALQAAIIGLVVFLSSFALARLFSYLLTAS